MYDHIILDRKVHRQYKGALGYRGYPVVGDSVAKAGLHALTRNLAIELAPHRIRVNAVAPAVVETPMY